VEGNALGGFLPSEPRSFRGSRCTGSHPWPVQRDSYCSVISSKSWWIICGRIPLAPISFRPFSRDGARRYHAADLARRSQPDAMAIVRGKRLR